MLLAATLCLYLAIAASAQSSQRYQCFPSGLCEPCPAEDASSAACRPFNNRRPLTCTALSSRPDYSASPAEVKAALPASDDLHFAAEADEGRTGAALLRNAHTNASRPQYRRRDFFWQDAETPLRKADTVMAAIDWDAVRTGEADRQGVTLPGTAFASWAPCARVIAKERSDFGEFLVRFVLS
jgi:hypothetical protein